MSSIAPYRLLTVSTWIYRKDVGKLVLVESSERSGDSVSEEEGFLKPEHSYNGLKMV